MRRAVQSIAASLRRPRFPARVGVVTELNEIDGGYQAEPTVIIEVEEQRKPACVAGMVLRYYV